MQTTGNGGDQRKPLVQHPVCKWFRLATAGNLEEPNIDISPRAALLFCLHDLCMISATVVYYVQSQVWEI